MNVETLKGKTVGAAVSGGLDSLYHHPVVSPIITSMSYASPQTSDNLTRRI